MFAAKVVSFVALVFPLASALTCNTPTNWTTASREVMTWSAGPTDPSPFSIELVHPSFNNKLAIGTNINAATQQADVSLPPVPDQSGYTVQFVDISNVTHIYCETGSFSIAPNPTTSLTTTLTSIPATANGVSSATNAITSSSTNPGNLAGTSTVGTGATPTSFGNSNGGASVLPSSGAMGFVVMAGAALAGAHFLGL